MAVGRVLGASNQNSPTQRGLSNLKVLREFNLDVCH